MEKKYVIDKNVPVPNRRDRNKYAELARSMQVGDSVLMPKGTPPHARQTMEKATGFKFLKRAEGDSFRVWRYA